MTFNFTKLVSMIKYQESQTFYIVGRTSGQMAYLRVRLISNQQEIIKREVIIEKKEEIKVNYTYYNLTIDKMNISGFLTFNYSIDMRDES